MAKKIKVDESELNKEIFKNYNDNYIKNDIVKVRKRLTISIVINILLCFFIVIIFANFSEERRELVYEKEIIQNDLYSIIGSNSTYYVKNKLSFMDENIVFVLEDYGNVYYTYDCVQQITNGEYSYWAFNLEAAKSKGYKKGGC